MTTPPFKGGQGRSYYDTMVSADLISWVFFAAILFAAGLTALVYWSNT